MGDFHEQHCLYEILFQIRENVFEDFGNVKTSICGQSHE
jgi:hypothetical protein